MMGDGEEMRIDGEEMRRDGEEIGSHGEIGGDGEEDLEEVESPRNPNSGCCVRSTFDILLRRDAPGSSISVSLSLSPSLSISLSLYLYPLLSPPRHSP